MTACACGATARPKQRTCRTCHAAAMRKSRGHDKDAAKIVARVVRATLELAAKACEAKVQRPAGYGGQWEEYGPWMGDKTGTECAAAIRALKP